MKPRLRRRQGIWVCSLIACGCFVPPLGHGYTPAEAFYEWASLCRLVGVRNG